MSHLKTTIPAITVVLALAAIPQQIAEGNRLRSELQAARDQPANLAKAVREPRTASRSRAGREQAEPWSPRTASSLLDDLGAPVDYRALAKQVISVSSPRHANQDPWACTILYARLNSLSEEEYAEFLNVMADYPAPEGLKRLTGLMMRMFHPGLAESWQETLERVMERGRGGNSLDSMGFWAREDPDAALAWYREKVASGEILGKGLETKFEKKTFESLVTILAASRPKEALEMFRDRPQELRSPGLADEITRKLTTGLIETGDDTYLRQMFELHDRSRVLQGALKEFVWSRKLGDGVAFVEQFVTDPGERTDYIVQAVCGQEGIGRQGAALDWMRANTPEAEAPELFRRLGAGGDIGHWIENQKPGVARDHAWLGSVDRTIEADAFPAALSRVNNIEDEELRDATRQRVGREWLQHDEAQAIEKLPVEVLRQIQNQ